MEGNVTEPDEANRQESGVRFFQPFTSLPVVHPEWERVATPTARQGTGKPVLKTWSMINGLADPIAGRWSALCFVLMGCPEGR